MKKFEGMCTQCLKDRGEMSVFLDEKLLEFSRILSEFQLMSPTYERNQYAEFQSKEVLAAREMCFSQRLRLEIEHLKDSISREIYETRKEERERAQKIIEEVPCCATRVCFGICKKWKQEALKKLNETL